MMNAECCPGRLSMLTFAYQAQDALGEILEGTLEVSSREEALAAL